MHKSKKHLNTLAKKIRIIILFVSCILFTSIALAQPANDECNGAIGITAGTTCSYTTYTNTGATYSSTTPLPGCASYTTAAADVWFKVIVPSTGALCFDTQTGNITNGGMAIYNGSCGALNLIECDDNDSPNGSMPMIYKWGLTPGETIFIRFWEYGGGTYGTFGLCVYIVTGPPACAANPIAGDYCSTATPICNLNGYCGNTSATYTPVVSPTNSTDEDSTPLGNVFCGSIENNSWLSFVADSSTSVLNVFVSNCSTTAGIQMQVYTTTDCYNYTAVSNCWNPASVVSGTVTSTGLVIGQTYYLMIDGNAGCVCDYIISAGAGVSSAINAGPDAAICIGQSITLQGTGGATYAWTPSTGLSDTTIANPVATPTVTTTYTVNGTSTNNNCPTSDEVTITVNPYPTSDFTVSSPNCNDNTATVTYTGTASPNANYAWNFSSGNATPGAGQGPHQVSWTSPGNYNITLTVTENNCASTLTLNNAMVSDIGTDPPEYSDVICYGEANGTATVNPVDGSAPYSYLWSCNPPQNTQTASHLSPGAYFVTVTDNVGCLTYDTIMINEPDSLSMGLTFENESCLYNNDGSISLAINGGIPPYQYVWAGLTQTSPDLSNLPAGSYSVTVSDSNNCTLTATIPIITESPIHVSFEVSPNDSILIDNTFNFTFTGNGAFEYFWDFGDNSTSTLANPTHQYTAEGEYTVWLVASTGDPDDCKDSLQMKVWVFLPPEIKLPNIFTPNGDGVNETFKADVRPESLLSEEMVIYNRWGKKIFSWNEIGGEWDGAKNADGVYFYIYTAVGKFDGKEIRYHGTVTMMR
ncbi:MAG TPA: gliding motility-associated C-terminal domain-containing protein [Bacteroidales bacterium]|nr:gliding motility-associated C-terminal domain-containing protein [Bacteroidales bacterium]